MHDASGMCLLDTTPYGEPCDFDRWVVAAANAAPALAREVLRLRALVRKKG